MPKPLVYSLRIWEFRQAHPMFSYTRTRSSEVSPMDIGMQTVGNRLKLPS